MKFSDIIGNRKVLGLLELGIHRKALYPSLIFHGMEGIGKKLAALTVAKAFNCLSEMDKPCDDCSICRGIDHLNDPDVNLIIPEFFDERLGKKDRKSLNVKIDQIRSLVMGITLRPYRSFKKIYIIDHAEMMTEDASNSLLKTLEEPPSYAIIILITSTFYSLLPTIRSRCWGVPFHPIPAKEIESYLLKKKNMDPQIAKKISLISEGSIKKAIQVDPEDFTARSRMLCTMIEKALDGDLSFIINGAEAISKNAEEFREHLNVLLTLFRDMITIQKTGDDTLLVNRELREKLKPLAIKMGREAIKMLGWIDEAKNLLRVNINRKVAAEALFFHLHPSSPSHAAKIAFQQNTF